jgi:hypothetical protein
MMADPRAPISELEAARQFLETGETVECAVPLFCKTSLGKAQPAGQVFIALTWERNLAVPKWEK